jgi:hypothetical protein
MTLLPRGLKVHLAFGYTDMPKRIDGLAMLVQGVLRQDPFSGHLCVFRGRRAGASRRRRSQLPVFASFCTSPRKRWGRNAPERA